MKKTFLLAAMLCSIFMGCNKGDESTGSSIIGVWETTENIDGSYDLGEYDYATFSFYKDHLGVYRLWKYTPNDAFGTASSDYQINFTWELDGPNLVLDCGFNYTYRYRDVRCSDGYLSMYCGTHYILCERSKMDDRNVLNDYRMQIVGNWKFEEKDMEITVRFRQDGSYKADCLNLITKDSFEEEGVYEVQNSRVRFSTNSVQSYLNERIYFITSLSNMKMHLMNEDGEIIVVSPLS